MSSQPESNPKCIFCKIIAKTAPADIIYEDDKLIVFVDIKPVSKHHFLVCPKEHIANVNSLGPGHKDLVEEMLDCGKPILEQRGGDMADARIGFHLPPFNSVSHLHMHFISPASEMSTWNTVAFNPNNWWFSSVDKILEKLGNSKL